MTPRRKDVKGASSLPSGDVSTACVAPPGMSPRYRVVDVVAFQADEVEDVEEDENVPRPMADASGPSPTRAEPSTQQKRRTDATYSGDWRAIKGRLTASPRYVVAVSWDYHDQPLACVI